MTKFNVTRRTFGRGLGLGLTAGAAGLFMPGIARHAMAAGAQDGGTLTVTLFKDLRTINPMMGIFGNEWRCTVNLYNNLTRLTASGGIEGDLAESFEGSDEARTWTFTLRQGVKFHDGSELTSADVVATFEKMLDPETSAPYKRELGPVASLKALSDYVVEFKLGSSFADFPKALAGATARIVSQAGIADFDSLGTMAHGTGPFRLVEFVANERIVMERNPNYFRSGLPHLDKVVMRILPDNTAQQAALQNQEVDVIADVDATIFASVSAISGVSGVSIPGGTFQNIVLLSNQAPFDNPKVREAAKYCLERTQISAVLTENTGSPGDDHPIGASYEFHDSNIALRTPDLSEARRLMREAGYGDGVEVDLVAANNPASRARLAVLAQAMTGQIGLKFNIEQMDNARYGSTVWNKGTKCYVGNYGTRPFEDAILSKLYHSSAGIDEGRWATPETDAMLDRARASLDPAERRAIYSEFQRRSRDNGPFLISSFQNSLFGVWDYVKDFPERAINTDMRLEETFLTAEAPGR
ncbi:MAG: ABC transporter substrate-binding protein [Rhizobiales bacterium]|nr:ABC transporter substrate-binding protein [Hyphomicrobiales bacterium]